MRAVEQVTIRVFIQCVGCGRKLDTSETLDGESLRTGNTTQRAEYWLNGMHQRIEVAAAMRGWADTERGPECAHCIAAEKDPRVDPVDQIDKGECA